MSGLTQRPLQAFTSRNHCHGAAPLLLSIQAGQMRCTSMAAAAAMHASQLIFVST